MLPDGQLEALVLTLHDIGAIRFGQFTLHSGRLSPIYLDLRLLASFPAAMRQAAAAYRPMLEELSFNLLAATPLAGLPIGTAISLDMNVPLIYPRGTAKSYGTRKRIEGKWSAGQTAVVVDDLITSGDSLLHSIHYLSEAGLQVTDAAVLVDREQGGRATLLNQGYNLHSAVKMSHLLAILEEKERITAAQRLEVQEALG